MPFFPPFFKNHLPFAFRCARRARCGKNILFLSLLLTVSQAFAAERASEADLFGGTAAPTAATTPATMDEQGLNGSSPKGFAPSSDDHLQIGGNFAIQGDVFIRHNVPLKDSAASNPNLLFLYADSKLDNDARVFAKLRLFLDPTGTSGGASGDLSNPYGSGAGASDNLKVSLQELKLSANIDKKLFFTFGRQKVKYGAAKFFNPTDFLNSQPLNFFLPSDERPGVDMVKAHLPSGTANLYAVGMVGTAGTTNPSGGYFRGELGYDGIEGFLGAGEIALSGILPRVQGPQTIFDLSRIAKAGFDISQELGDLDFYFEGAAGQADNGDWKMAGSVGASWQIRYADRSSNTVSLQGEYFNAGQTAEFGVLSIFLPEPGDLKDVSFVATSLFSFQDESGLSRLDILYNFTPQINGRLYGSGHWGKVGGVLHFPGQVAELGTRLDVNF
jgi:hypothetical protein